MIMDSNSYIESLQREDSFEPVGLGITYDASTLNMTHPVIRRSQDNYGQFAAVFSAGGTPEIQAITSPYISSRSSPALRSDGEMRTRSGRAVRQVRTPNTSTPRSTPPSSKRVREKKMKPKNLSAPLSQLTKHMKDVPVRNMEAWVNRPIRDRLEEAKKRKGYITRPMNSFMLYRSAYAERTKAWCAENNHQVVSAVSGESWPMEPPEIRDYYNDLAKAERLNHQAAHPEYKFSPAKPGLAGRKRKEVEDSSDDDEDDESIFSEGDADAEWGPSTRRQRNKKVAREVRYPSARNTRTPTPVVSQEPFQPAIDVYGRPIWEADAYGCPLPVTPIGQQPFPAQYYQQNAAHPYLMTPPQNHSLYDVPEHQDYDAMPALVGLPGLSQYDLRQLHSQTSTPVPSSFDHQVDPLLLEGYGFEPTYAMDSQTHSSQTLIVPRYPSTIMDIGYPTYQSHLPYVENAAPSLVHRGEFGSLFEDSQRARTVFDGIDTVMTTKRKPSEDCLTSPKTLV